MNKSEFTTLFDRVNELSACLPGRSPQTEAAQAIWRDALNDCLLDDVLFALTDWPKSHKYMPSPADIRKEAQSRVSDRVDAQARAWAAESRQSSGISGLKADSSVAKEHLAKIKAILSSPKPGPKEWARKLRAKGNLTPLEASAVREALRFEGEGPAPQTSINAALDRVELIEERAAIQSESRVDYSKVGFFTD